MNTTVKDWTAERAKGIAAFIGAGLTFATTLDWGFDIPGWVTAIAAVLTFVSVYGLPNKDAAPAHGDPVNFGDGNHADPPEWDDYDGEEQVSPLR